MGDQLNAGHSRDLTVRPEPVEGWAVKSFMVRQGSPERRRRAHHERLNLKLSRLKLVAKNQLGDKQTLNLITGLYGQFLNKSQ